MIEQDAKFGIQNIKKKQAQNFFWWLTLFPYQNCWQLFSDSLAIGQHHIFVAFCVARKYSICAVHDYSLLHSYKLLILRMKQREYHLYLFYFSFNIICSRWKSVNPLFTYQISWSVFSVTAVNHFDQDLSTFCLLLQLFYQTMGFRFSSSSRWTAQECRWCWWALLSFNRQDRQSCIRPGW